MGRASRSKRERRAERDARAQVAAGAAPAEAAFELEYFGAPLDDQDLLSLAAVGITNATWRNSPVENVHAAGDGGGVTDGDMMRLNVAMTKLVRGFIIDPDSIDLAALYEALVNPNLVLPTGGPLEHLLGSEFDSYSYHVDVELGVLDISTSMDGVRSALRRAALHGGLACAFFWGTPWWPAVVESIVARASNPKPWVRDFVADGHLSASGVALLEDKVRLRTSLLEGPESLTADEAQAVVIVSHGVEGIAEREAWADERRTPEAS